MDCREVVLNPDYNFKDDIDRVVMYSRKDVDAYSNADWVSYVHPLQAYILSLFSNGAYMENVSRKLSREFNTTEENINRLISQYIENKDPIYTMFKGQMILFPSNVLLYKENIRTSKPSHNNWVYSKYEKIDLTPDRMHRAPQSMLFMLTHKCVTSCKYCYADRSTKYAPLSTKKILGIIDEARTLEMTYIDVIGGELFCKQDWNIILHKLVRENLSPSYISTKVPLNSTLIRKIKDTEYKNVIQLSVDTLDNDVSKNILSVGDGYAEMIERSLPFINMLENPIQIDTILTKYNSNTQNIVKLFEFIKKIKNILYWEIRVPELSLYNRKSFLSVKASYQEIIDVKRFVKEEIEPKSPFKIYFSDEPLTEKYRSFTPDAECFTGGSCGILNNRMFVLPDGKVSVCEQMYWHKDSIIGDLKYQSIEEVWSSMSAWNFFNQELSNLSSQSKCFDCPHSIDCRLKHRKCIVKTSKAYGLEHWDYPDPRCVFAPKINNELLYE